MNRCSCTGCWPTEGRPPAVPGPIPPGRPWAEGRSIGRRMVTTAPEACHRHPPEGTDQVDPGVRATPGVGQGPPSSCSAWPCSSWSSGIVGSAFLGRRADVTIRQRDPRRRYGRAPDPGHHGHASPSSAPASRPADILGNLAVPTGSTVVRTVNIDQNAAQFDRTVYFTRELSSARWSMPTGRCCPGWAGRSSTRDGAHQGPAEPRSWPRTAAATASTGRSGWSSPPPPRPGRPRTRSSCSRLPDDN